MLDISNTYSGKTSEDTLIEKEEKRKELESSWKPHFNKANEIEEQEQKRTEKERQVGFYTKYSQFILKIV